MLTLKEFREYLQEKLMVFGRKAYPNFGHVLIIAGGAGCFDGETLVQTESGNKKISDIGVGDKVKSYNEETGQYSFQSVVDLYQYDGSTKNMVEIEFEDGEIVRCTEDHEFLVDGDWIQAKDLI